MEKLRDVVTVIDADGHVRDLDDMIKPYLREPFKNRLSPSFHGKTMTGALGEPSDSAGSSMTSGWPPWTARRSMRPCCIPLLGLA